MKLIFFTLCSLLLTQYSSSSPSGIGDWFKKAGDWVDGAVKDSKDWVDGAVKDSKDWVDGAVKDSKDWVDGAAKDSKDWVDGAVKDSKDWIDGAARDTDKWIKGAVRDTDEWVKGAAGSVTDFFNKAGEEITKAFDDVKDKWNDFERDANKFFKNIGDSMKKSFEDIKKRIEETGDSFIKIIFEKIYEGLQNAKDKLEEVSRTADEKFETAMSEVHDKLFTATSQVQNFMSSMRQVINTKTEKNQGMAILERYLRDSTEKIESCSDAAIQPIKTLYEQTKELLSTAINKLEDFIRDIEGCLDKGLSAETATCGHNLGEIAKSSLKELGSQLIDMKLSLISSAFTEVANFVCIIQSRIYVEKGKSVVRSAINNLK